MPVFDIRRADPTEPDAKSLIERHVVLMASQSPEDSCHVLDGEGLDSPDVAFFLLRRESSVLAMGALKTLGGGALELKSMHTVAQARGTGAGRAMLEHLLAFARSQGATDIYLETGSTEDFTAARSLYEGYGFAECPPFEGYEEDPWSIFMHLALRGAA